MSINLVRFHTCNSNCYTMLNLHLPVFLFLCFNARLDEGHHMLVNNANKSLLFRMLVVSVELAKRYCLTGWLCCNHLSWFLPWLPVSVKPLWNDIHWTNSNKAVEPQLSVHHSTLNGTYWYLVSSITIQLYEVIYQNNFSWFPVQTSRVDCKFFRKLLWQFDLSFTVSTWLQFNHCI